MGFARHLGSLLPRLPTNFLQPCKYLYAEWNHAYVFIFPKPIECSYQDVFFQLTDETNTGAMEIKGASTGNVFLHFGTRALHELTLTYHYPDRFTLILPKLYLKFPTNHSLNYIWKHKTWIRHIFPAASELICLDGSQIKFWQQACRAACHVSVAF